MMISSVAAPVASGPTLLNNPAVTAHMASSPMISDSGSGSSALLTPDTVTISPEGAAASAALSSAAKTASSGASDSDAGTNTDAAPDASDASTDSTSSSTSTQKSSSHGGSGGAGGGGGLSSDQISELTSTPISFTVDGVHYSGSVTSDSDGYTATASGVSGSGQSQQSAEASLEMRVVSR